MIKKNIILVTVVVVGIILISKYCKTNDDLDYNDESDSAYIDDTNTSDTNNNTSSTSSTGTLNKNDITKDKKLNLNKDKNIKNSETNQLVKDSAFSNEKEKNSHEYVKEVMDKLSNKIGLQSFSLSNFSTSSRGKNIELVFKTLTTPSCHLGDIDAINFDNTKSPNVLVSVEDILATENNFDPSAYFVSTKDLENTTLYFKIPTPSSALIAGLFICKDTANDRRCNNKSSYDISQLLKYYSLTSNITNPSITKDKIYFFQTLIITPETLYILDTKQTNKDMSELKRSLKQILNIEDSILTSQIQRIKSLNKNVYSKNVIIDKNSITLSLPKQDKTVCDK